MHALIVKEQAGLEFLGQDPGKLRFSGFDQSFHGDVLEIGHRG
jgi:hypothetical protein